MKRCSLDMAFARILLVAVPFSCGPQTFYEAVPPMRCTTDRTMPIELSQLQADGGAGPDGGGAGTDGGGAGADGGVTPDAGSGSTYFLSASQCSVICSDTMNCQVSEIGQGQGIVTCYSSCGYAVGCGRRPAELPLPSVGNKDALAHYFEQAAYLEAASVHAFRRLASELSAHGAPQSLVSAAQRAAEDEVRHARVMARLAKRYGGTPIRPPEGPHHVRPLFDIASENIVEGCVHETYGALVAWLQTGQAGDPQVRRALRPIAVEETEHARLAWAVARWLHTKLAEAERRAIYASQKEAVAQLDAAVRTEPPAALIQLAGLPTRLVATRLVSEARRTLWS